jgi:hypothetical protein
VERPEPRIEDVEDRPVALHEVGGGDPLRLARVPPVEGAPGGSSRPPPAGGSIGSPGSAASRAARVR